jgi:hypothetical protein
MITDAAMGTYCDHCKAKYGRLKDNSDWHQLAKKQALLVAVSLNGQSRAYCKECLDYIEQGWGKDGKQTWTLQEQMSDVLKGNIPELRGRLVKIAETFKQREHRITSRVYGYQVIEETEVANV